MMTIEQFRSPELAALYSGRYVERVLDYHAGIFSVLIAVGEIWAEDSAALAMMYAVPVLTLIGVCDRQPERESECLERLERHVRLFSAWFMVPLRVYLKNSLRLHHGVFSAISASKNLDLAPLNLRFSSLN